MKRLFHLVKLERFDDGFDFFHGNGFLDGAHWYFGIKELAGGVPRPAPSFCSFFGGKVAQVAHMKQNCLFSRHVAQFMSLLL
jgi:hypothetical protein